MATRGHYKAFPSLHENSSTIVHTFIWNYDDVKAGWYFLSSNNLKNVLQPFFQLFWKKKRSKGEPKREILANSDIDSRYVLIVSNGYEEVHNWWYAIILLFSFESLYLSRETFTTQHGKLNTMESQDSNSTSSRLFGGSLVICT
ncbi:putative opt oligopeptide transporter protein [Botrytis fragariae]|uniref:Putative opt oligopeptide transporter protein n=1 Tax=Botrytis fragariae TaxID=1964551 RepID=A0A8H6AIL5_9HELO|nr:putative opt oligopeptide transporter protein [Botrytis fragariae]KAF5868312.1 putative opt oligopeptide transporter protein [Botrytis fragariae]